MRFCESKYGHTSTYWLYCMTVYVKHSHCDTKFYLWFVIVTEHECKSEFGIKDQHNIIFESCVC